MNRLDLIIDALEQACRLLNNQILSGLDLQEALAAARELKELAQPEQKLNDPPAYVEPPTSDYHNGWEEGFEAAKNLFKKESAPQNADPRLLLGRKDNCIALAQPEQEPVAWATFDGEGNYDFRSYEDNETYRDEYIKRNSLKYANWVKPLYTAPPSKPWVGLTDDEIQECQRLGLSDDVYKAIETKLKERNT